MPSRFSRFLQSFHVPRNPHPAPPAHEKDESFDEKASPPRRSTSSGMPPHSPSPSRSSSTTAAGKRPLRLSLDFKSRFRFRSSSSTNSRLPHALHITVTLNHLPSNSPSPPSVTLDPQRQPPLHLPSIDTLALGSSPFLRPFEHNPLNLSTSSLLAPRPTSKRHRSSASARPGTADIPTISTLSPLPSISARAPNHVSLRKWGKVRIRPSLEDVFGPIIPLKAPSERRRSGSTNASHSAGLPYQLHPPPQLLGRSPSARRASNPPVLPPLPQAQPLDLPNAFLDWVDDSPTHSILSVHVQRRMSTRSEAARVPFPSLSLEDTCAIRPHPKRASLPPNVPSRRRLVSAMLAR